MAGNGQGAVMFFDVLSGKGLGCFWCESALAGLAVGMGPSQIGPGHSAL
jgi:hypothetical protein